MGMGMGMGMEGARGGTPLAVAKPNVTTSATADASMKRRINEAKFRCDVPGCGSTFTRHFNLKGACAPSLRSSSFGSRVLTDGFILFYFIILYFISLAGRARRAQAVAQRREAVPVQVARVRQGLRAAARLQAARAAALEPPPVFVRGLQEAVCAAGRAESAP